MDIKRALPRPQLRAVVRSFEERRAELGSAVLTWPVAARPHQILNIHMADPYRVRIDGGPANITPEMSLVGPQTYRRAHVYLSGMVHVFNILFQPTGLNRLFGINMTCLVIRTQQSRMHSANLLLPSATLYVRHRTSVSV